jgi:hypothetical protein
MGLMVENMTVEDILLLALRFSPISTEHYVILAINNIIKYNTFLSPSLIFLPPSEYVVLFGDT